MYDPFVRACNCALEKLSDIDGLPEVSEEKKIVFARNHDRAVGSGSHQRTSRVRPDIVLLSWKIFKKRRGLPDVTYSQSHEDDICVSKSDKGFSWKDIRSTVELKITGLPKKKEEWKGGFDGGFKALKELPAHTSLDDAHHTATSHPRLPNHTCECTPFGGFWSLSHSKDSSRSSARSAKDRDDIEDDGLKEMPTDKRKMTSDNKRKKEAELSDNNVPKASSKRIRVNDPSHEKSQTQNAESSRKGTAGNSGPRGISRKHPVNIQNGIYAAERLSCSLGVTHSLNFILRGECWLSAILRAVQLTQDFMFQGVHYTSRGRTGKTLFKEGASISSTIYLTSS